MIVEYELLFSEFSDLKTGPKADHRGSEREGMFKTYSLKYLASIFANKKIVDMYCNFLELIFSESSPQELCGKWKFQCCEGEHSDECSEKWENLKNELMKKSENRAHDEESD